jgi:hypothetical protein
MLHTKKRRRPANQGLSLQDARTRMHDTGRRGTRGSGQAAPVELAVAARPDPARGRGSVDASLWEVTRRALAAESGDLPVIAPRERGRFVGVIVIADVLDAAREP